MEEERSSINLREAFGLIKKNLLAILLCAVVCATAAYAISEFLITPQYEASAMLIVNASDSTTSTSATTITNDQVTTAQELVNTYSVILTSDTVLNQVIKDLELDMTATELKSRITATAVESTQVMEITMTDPDPEVAKAVVAEILALAPDVLTQTIKAGSVEVVSEADVSTDPVSPKIPLNMAMGAFIGLLLSIGVIVLRKISNNTFVTDDDITQNLSFTVIGVIPKVSMRG